MIFGTLIILVFGLPVVMANEPVDLGTSPYLIVVFSVIFVFATRNAMRKRKVLFESLKITIDEDKITREQLNTPVLVIYKKDVKRILKSVGGTF